MGEKYFSNIINLKLSKSKRLCLIIFQIEKNNFIRMIDINYWHRLEKISRENIQKDPITLRMRLTVCCKQTRSTRWLAVVLFVALLLTGLYLA